MSTYQKVLPPEVLKAFQKYRVEINYQGVSILDRWAINTPEKLVALATSTGGAKLLLMRVLQQQKIELDILTSLEGLEQRKWLAQHEILELYDVNMEL